MDKMRFKSFVWPVNPEHYGEETRREPQYETSYGIAQYQGLGKLKRVITGSGAFSGEQAYAEFSQLAALLEQSDSGTLFHPLWGERQVYFIGLEMTQEPRENYVAYRFEFRQADDENKIPK